MTLVYFIALLCISRYIEIASTTILTLGPMVGTPSSHSENDSLILLCNNKKQEVLRIIWTHNNHLINKTDKSFNIRQPSPNHPLSSLRIRLTWKNDNSIIQCKHKLPNNSLAMSNPYIINVTYVPRVQIVGVKTLDLGKILNLTCKFNSTPRHQKIRWLKDGKLLHHVTTVKLRKQNSDLKDSGVYKCEVTNSVGTGSAIKTVEVLKLWDNWGAWTPCSKNCTRTRTRNCVASKEKCIGDSTVTIRCTECEPVTAARTDSNSHLLPLILGCVASFIIGVIGFLIWRRKTMQTRKYENYVLDYDDPSAFYGDDSQFSHARKNKDGNEVPNFDATGDGHGENKGKSGMRSKKLGKDGAVAGIEGEKAVETHASDVTGANMSGLLDSRMADTDGETMGWGKAKIGKGGTVKGLLGDGAHTAGARDEQAALDALNKSKSKSKNRKKHGMQDGDDLNTFSDLSDVSKGHSKRSSKPADKAKESNKKSKGGVKDEHKSGKGKGEKAHGGKHSRICGVCGKYDKQASPRLPKGTPRVCGVCGEVDDEDISRGGSGTSGKAGISSADDDLSSARRGKSKKRKGGSSSGGEFEDESGRDEMPPLMDGFTASHKSKAKPNKHSRSKGQQRDSENVGDESDGGLLDNEDDIDGSCGSSSRRNRRKNYYRKTSIITLSNPRKNS